MGWQQQWNGHGTDFCCLSTGRPSSHICSASSSSIFLSSSDTSPLGIGSSGNDSCGLWTGGLDPSWCCSWMDDPALPPKLGKGGENWDRASRGVKYWSPWLEDLLYWCIGCVFCASSALALGGEHWYWAWGNATCLGWPEQRWLVSPDWFLNHWRQFAKEQRSW